MPDTVPIDPAPRGTCSPYRLVADVVTLLGQARVAATLIGANAPGAAHAASDLLTALGVTPDPAPTTWQARRDRDNRRSRWPANP